MLAPYALRVKIRRSLKSAEFEVFSRNTKKDLPTMGRRREVT